MRQAKKIYCNMCGKEFHLEKRDCERRNSIGREMLGIFFRKRWRDP